MSTKQTHLNVTTSVIWSFTEARFYGGKTSQECCRTVA